MNMKRACGNYSMHLIPNHDNEYIIDHYVNDALPLFGWFKPCYECGTISGSFCHYKYTKLINIRIDLCKRCIRKNTDLTKYWKTYFSGTAAFVI